MLSEIHIKGLAVIDELSINFSENLNVITGETGAGKSILIKALSLVLGGKGSADVVRKGSELAVVSACFALNPQHHVNIELENNGVCIDRDEGLLILRRQVNHRGRSQAWINDTPVTLSVLKRVGSGLIDVFGQHENHKLLDASQHCHYLDQFLNSPHQLADYKTLFQSIWKEFKSLSKDINIYQEKLRDRDYLEFRKTELDRLSPSILDYNQQKSFLEESKENLEKHQVLKKVESILDRGYSAKPLSRALGDVVRELSPLFDDSKLLERAHELEENLNQLSFAIGKALSDSDFNENEIQQAKERLSTYSDIMHKMNVRSVENLIETYKELTREIEFIENGQSSLEDRVHRLYLETEKLANLGHKLTASRKRAFHKIKKQIRKELDQLNMKGADLFLQLNPVEHRLSHEFHDLFEDKVHEAYSGILEVISQASIDGLEKPQFLLRSNPGDEPKPLSKIASGGEISRIMLGIKKVLSEGAHTCVMVFDEIDTGISGQTASIVGRKLSEISKRFQVICISHLPQVAVYGNSHFKVHKSIVRGRAESKITRMSQNQCIQEIARLLSSGDVTESSLENARELFRGVRKFAASRDQIV